MMFSYIVEGGYHIDTNVSEIHSGNCVKSIVHAQNIILLLVELGFFTCLG